MKESEIKHGIKHSQSQKLIDFACEFAIEAHGSQLRKYTSEPYINHPISVARLVASVTDDCEIISAALLHDVIEDTAVTFNEIKNAGFGLSIAKLVNEVTDVSRPSDGNRAHRKRLDLEHLSKASKRAKTIKLADLIDNSSSICKHDERFAKVYMQEKEALLDVLKDGDPELYSQASKIVMDYYAANAIDKKQGAFRWQ